MLNFSELVEQVAILAQRKDDADYALKIKAWINLSQNTLVNSYDFWSALQDSHRFSSVDGTEKYFMPSVLDKPYRILDRTNSRKLKMMTREEYYEVNISSVVNTSKATPGTAMLYGVNAVSYEPTSSFTVQVKSSSTEDNGGITVRVEGWLDSSKTIIGHETITISTSSPTSYVAGTTTFYGIKKCVKSGDTEGYITLADDSSNVLATLAPYERASRYPVLYLGLIPDAVISYELLYKMKSGRLVENEDIPFMDCEDYLILNATGYAFHQEKESADRAESMWKKAEEQLGILLRNEQDKLGPDFQHKMVNANFTAHRQ